VHKVANRELFHKTQQGPKMEIPLNLRLILEGVVEDAGLEGMPEGKSVVIDHADDCWLTRDPALLRSCMENAVPNAIHYTKAYTDIVILPELVGNGRSSEARFRVVDHADGVPPEALSRLFEPFASLRHESAKPAEAA
jgi:signal transduction histidine kinase